MVRSKIVAVDKLLTREQPTQMILCQRILLKQNNKYQVTNLMILKDKNPIMKNKKEVEIYLSRKRRIR